MRRADAGVHHDHQPAALRAGRGVLAGDAGLQPQRLGADRDGFVGDGRRVFRAAEDVDDVDALGDVDERRIRLLAENLGLARVDGNDAIAGAAGASA